MLEEKLKYAIHFCKSIDTDDYARIELRDDDFTIIDEIPDVINSLTVRADQAAASSSSRYICHPTLSYRPFLPLDIEAYSHDISCGCIL